MAATETPTCQNCNKAFDLSPADIDFYKKIEVPHPTFCPRCRMIRRFTWRNERTLYRRACDLCKKNLVSIYSSKSPYTVYCNTCFHGDGWDPLKYALEIDFSKPFFEQFRELQLKVPRLYSFVVNNVNSEYTNGAAFNKNCYLIFVSDYCEDSSYSYAIMHSKNISDCFNCSECELCYESVGCFKCYRTTFSEDCSDCQNVSFCKNCTNCQDCVGCVNLRNQKYHIFNEPYSKEEYFKKIKEMNLGSRESVAIIQKKLQDLSSRYISKYIHGSRNLHVSGDYLYNSKESYECYDADSLEDCKRVNHADHIKNVHDAYSIIDNSQYSYEVISASGLNNVKFGYCVWGNFDLFYSDTCENSNNLFGCVSLRKKSYCILNKEYSKEEYEALIPKLIQHMKDMPYREGSGKIYSFGEFFPTELCPFAYNETAAQEYFPLTKEKALAQGYRWAEPESRNYEITLATESIPASIAATPDAIVEEVVGCEHQGNCTEDCTSAFKVTSSELQFYRQMELPIPVLCPNCRHARRLQKKNPPTLWKRKCNCAGTVSENGIYKNNISHFHEDNACPTEFETSYSSDRSEIIYCEQCYQSEVA